MVNQRIQRWKRLKFPCASRKTDTKIKGIPLVITYCPLLKDFPSVIRKRLHILYLNKEVNEITGQENWEATLLGLNRTPQKGQLDRLNVMVNNVKYT